MDKKHIFVTDVARNAVIRECIKELENCGYTKAAIILSLLLK